MRSIISISLFKCYISYLHVWKLAQFYVVECSDGLQVSWNRLFIIYDLFFVHIWLFFKLEQGKEVIKFWHRKSKKSHFAKFQKVQLNIIKVQFCLMKLLYWTITIHNFPKQFIKIYSEGGTREDWSPSPPLNFWFCTYVWLKIYYSKFFYKITPPLKKIHSALTAHYNWLYEIT